MLDPETWTPARFPPDQPPLLAVVVDTEEEFDWSKPHARDCTAVTTVRHQERAHRVFDAYGIKPTYVVDYPVASQADGYRPLQALLEDGACEIGTHLHPWVNPPFDEEVSAHNSYPGNLPPDLERAKLQRLTETIGETFGIRSTVYRAGRYGVGPASARILADLGYRVDSSVVSYTDFRDDQGPDFRHCGVAPYWFGDGTKLLEVPVTTSFAGMLGEAGQGLYEASFSPAWRRLRLPGILARAGVVERIRLTPEGITPAENRRLVSAMLKAGHKVFTFNYHSPSLAAGHTPYVRTEADLAAFLDGFRRFFDFFFGEAGGAASTLTELRELAERADADDARQVA